MHLGGSFYSRQLLSRRSFIAVLGLLGLSACTSLQPSASGTLSMQRDRLQSFSIEARFSLRHEEKSYTGRLSWRHAGSQDDLLLASPFGQGMARIASDANGVRLTASDGSLHQATDTETLTKQVLGFPLPLKNLADWVRGRRSDAGFEAQDAFGRPLRVRRDGWQIDYEYDSDDPQALPGRLFIEREGVLELRLRIDEWNALRDEGARP